MDLTPTPMASAFARLEPFAEAWRAPLRAACAADTEIWTALYPMSWAPAEFDQSFDLFLRENASGLLSTYVVTAGGACVGMSGFSAISPANRSVEIGGTYYAPDARGGAVNPAVKRMLLGRAFDAGARRVQLKVDALNARSRAAVRKLGAVEEGVLRQDRVCWTGRIRDTVMFSILDAEWPAVRDRLDARLADLATTG